MEYNRFTIGLEYNSKHTQKITIKLGHWVVMIFIVDIRSENPYDAALEAIDNYLTTGAIRT